VASFNANGRPSNSLTVEATSRPPSTASAPSGGQKSFWLCSRPCVSGATLHSAWSLSKDFEELTHRSMMASAAFSFVGGTIATVGEGGGQVEVVPEVRSEYALRLSRAFQRSAVALTGLYKRAVLLQVAIDEYDGRSGLDGLKMGGEGFVLHEYRSSTSLLRASSRCCEDA
jgi:hypothetical protein